MTQLSNVYLELPCPTTDTHNSLTEVSAPVFMTLPLFFFFFFAQMYLVIFPEGTRYNPELKKVIDDSQAFAAKEGIFFFSV